MMPENRPSDTGRIRKLNRNFFLHIHATKIHPLAMDPGYSMGLGLILVFLFLIMIASGLVLMLHYSPSVERAYDSVRDINFIVPGGRIIRNLHRWGAHGMVLVSFLHLIRVFYTGSYLRSRSTNWVIGVCMLVLVLFMNFSGYLLPWDQLSYWAVTIGSGIAASARELTDLIGITGVFDAGGFLKKLLIGGETVGQQALSRFFMLHVVFLPLTLGILCGVHFWRIRKDGGLNVPVAGGSKWYAWPVLMWAELATLLCVVVALLTLAMLIDAPLREPANPAFPDNPARSPWYFLGIQELVSHSAFSGGMVIPVLFIAFLVSIPYIDREDRYAGRWFSSPVGVRISLISAVLSVAVTVGLTALSEGQGWFGHRPEGFMKVVDMVVNPAAISATCCIVWGVVVRKRTGSTRLSAMALFTFGFTAYVVFTALGLWFRGPDWQFFWPGADRPVV